MLVPRPPPVQLSLPMIHTIYLIKNSSRSADLFFNRSTSLMPDSGASVSVSHSWFLILCTAACMNAADCIMFDMQASGRQRGWSKGSEMNRKIGKREGSEECSPVFPFVCLCNPRRVWTSMLCDHHDAGENRREKMYRSWWWERKGKQIRSHDKNARSMSTGRHGMDRRPFSSSIAISILVQFSLLVIPYFHVLHCERNRLHTTCSSHHCLLSERRRCFKQIKRHVLSCKVHGSHSSTLAAKFCIEALSCLPSDPLIPCRPISSSSANFLNLQLFFCLTPCSEVSSCNAWHQALLISSTYRLYHTHWPEFWSEPFFISVS